MMNDLIYLSSQKNVLPSPHPPPPPLYQAYFEINAPKPKQSAVTFLIFLSSLSWSLIKLIF